MRISDWSSDVCSSYVCFSDLTLDLIGQRQIARIEYAHLGAEQDEQAGRLLHRKPAERTRAQRTIEQQDTRRWIERTKARRQIMPDHRAIERRHEIGIGKCTQAGHQQIRLKRKAALAGQSERNSALSAISAGAEARGNGAYPRSEEHTSELQ